MSKVTVSHDPRECRQALAGASGPVVIDLETTGLHRTDAIVSVGVLVGEMAFILFVGSRHASIRNIGKASLAHALEPLARPDLVVMGHNFRFDLGFLARAGIPFRARIVDSLKLLRLLDQDRGGDNAERRRPRIDRRAPVGTQLLLNYRLKDAVPQLLGVRLRDFPGRIEVAPYREHTLYLANDLVGTRLLGDFLWGSSTTSCGATTGPSPSTWRISRRPCGRRAAPRAIWTPSWPGSGSWSPGAASAPSRM